MNPEAVKYILQQQPLAFISLVSVTSPMFGRQTDALFLNCAFAFCESVKSSEPRAKEVNEVEQNNLKLVTSFSCCEQCITDS